MPRALTKRLWPFSPVDNVPRRLADDPLGPVLLAPLLVRRGHEDGLVAVEGDRPDQAALDPIAGPDPRPLVALAIGGQGADDEDVLAELALHAVEQRPVIDAQALGEENDAADGLGADELARQRSTRLEGLRLLADDHRRADQAGVLEVDHRRREGSIAEPPVEDLAGGRAPEDVRARVMRSHHLQNLGGALDLGGAEGEHQSLLGVERGQLVHRPAAVSHVVLKSLNPHRS
jgi:hypothetical protein